MTATRTEHDLLGDKQVPADAYYGVQTARALENFHISGVELRLYPNFIRALAMVKLAAARAKFGWRFEFALLGQAWHAGCIIRAPLLIELVGEADGVSHALLAPRLRQRIAAAEAGWRRTVAAAVAAGVAVPALASSLAYVDAMRMHRLWTAMIQAQRDFFGAHGLARIDRPGRFHLDGSSADEGNP